MSKVTHRVKIPTNARKLIDLVKLILAKHTADGATSPLNAIDMADMTTKFTAADTQDALAVQLRKDSEKARESRDLALGKGKGKNSQTPGTMAYNVGQVVSILEGIYRDNPQKLGDWGIEVNSSPKAVKKPATPTA